jgi:enamine deaminase RidA (YjgF/YER057c/UK114 family)
MKILQPPGWPRPKGYANGVAARGTLVYVAGQIGWTPEGRFESDALAPQIEQALRNTLAVLETAGARPEHVVRMTWYLLDRDEYLARAPEVGAVWRRLMGSHYPAMAVVQVTALIEPRARIEIETTAVIPDT